MKRILCYKQMLMFLFCFAKQATITIACNILQNTAVVCIDPIWQSQYGFFILFPRFLLL